MEKIFCKFLILCQIYFSSQVKRNVIISNQHVVYTSCVTSCRRTSDFGSEDIRNNQKNLKPSQNYNLVPSLSLKIKFFLILPKKVTKKQKLKLFQSAVFHMKSRVCLKHFVHNCRLNLVYIISTKKRNDRVFHWDYGKEYHLIN